MRSRPTNKQNTIFDLCHIACTMTGMIVGANISPLGYEFLYAMGGAFFGGVASIACILFYQVFVEDGE